MTTPASALIRASIAALREHEHNVSGPWHPHPTGVVAEDGSNVGMLIVESYNPKTDAQLMRHIALLASPDVARALAALLDKINDMRNFTDTAATRQGTLNRARELGAKTSAMHHAADALEQAITHREQP